MDRPMTFANWLKRARRQKGLTQRVLNEKAGLGKNYVTALEGGSVELPTKATRQALHFVLGTSDQDLIELGLLEIDPYTGDERVPAQRPAPVQTVEQGEPERTPGNPFPASDYRHPFVEALKSLPASGPDFPYWQGYVAGQVQLLRDVATHGLGPSEEAALDTTGHVYGLDDEGHDFG